MVDIERLRPLGRRLPPIISQAGIRALRASAVPGSLVRYVRDRRVYRHLPGAEPLRWRDTFPALGDRLASSPFDAHYFYQDTWAAGHVAALSPELHVDVGSRVDYVGFLAAAVCEVRFVDIRPLHADIERLSSVSGSVLEMPFATGSLTSLSCLHVAEHIGLGRYGDPLDPLGTRKAAAELARVLAPGGALLFSLPVGAPRVCFNAHRIHAPQEVRSMFPELELMEFAGVDDQGLFRRQRTVEELAGSVYACGMFRFVKPAAA
jgi:SAM-dependent methyltransferase